MSLEVMTQGDLVRIGVMDILCAARAMTEVTGSQFVELVRCCLQTHAWCVREELNANILSIETKTDEKITAEVIKALLEVAAKEREEHTTQLRDFATALLGGFTKH